MLARDLGSHFAWPVRSSWMKIQRAMSAATWIVTPDKFLTEQQVRTLRAAMEVERTTCDRYGVRNAAIVETLLGSGFRVSELCALTVGDLFLEPGHANLLVRRGKGNKSRLVAVSTALATYLSAFLDWKAVSGEVTASTNPLFLSERGGPLHRSAVHRIWKAALARAGLPTRHGVHAARHTYAVEIYRRTKDLRLTQRQLGHSSPVVTQVYASLVDDDVRRGVEQIWAA